MAKKMVAAVLALSFLGILAVVPDAVAKRRCPRGFDDNGTNVCLPK